MEDIMPQGQQLGNKKQMMVAGGVVVLIIAAVAAYVVLTRDTDSQDGGDFDPDLNIYGATQNPVEEVPQTNPFEKPTNPFTEYKNPFE